MVVGLEYFLLLRFCCLLPVPPREVQLLQSGSEVGAALTVDQGTQYTLQCSVQGTRPAASIQWLVSNAMPSTGVADPTSTLNNGLYDTLGSWTFTADRTHHKQEVKCVANTDESTQPYPEDTTIIYSRGKQLDVEKTQNLLLK